MPIFSSTIIIAVSIGFSLAWYYKLEEQRLEAEQAERVKAEQAERLKAKQVERLKVEQAERLEAEKAERLKENEPLVTGEAATEFKESNAQLYEKEEFEAEATEERTEPLMTNEAAPATTLIVNANQPDNIQVSAKGKNKRKGINNY